MPVPADKAELLRRIAVIGFVIFAATIFVFALVTTPVFPESPPPEPALTGMTWEGTAIFDGSGTGTRVIAGTRIFVQFSTDGTVSGSSGCNRFNGKFSTGRGTLAISEPGGTEMFCTAPEGIMQQEDRFLAALGRSVLYGIHGNVLTLSDAGGAPLLTFSGES